MTTPNLPATSPAHAARPRPWVRRSDWARGEIVSTTARDLAFWWFFALLWNALAWPGFGIVAVPAIRRGVEGAWLAGLFPLVGVGLLAAALRTVWRRVQYGRCRFLMAPVPAPVGGVLEGRVVVPRGLGAATEVLVSLGCVRRVTSGAQGRRHTRRHLLWYHDTEVGCDSLRFGRDGCEIPVRIPIDGSCEATDPDERIDWELSVSAAAPGVDFAATFVVPVFRVPGTAPAAAERQAAPPLRHASLERLAAAGVRWDAAGISGAPTFVIAPAFPGAGAFVALGLGGILLYGAHLLHSYRLSPLGAVVVVALLGAVILLGVLGMFRGPTRVVLAPDALTIGSRGLFGRKTRRIEPQRIRAVRAGPGGAQHGKLGTYQLLLACDASPDGRAVADVLFGVLVAAAGGDGPDGTTRRPALPVPVGGVFRSRTAADEAAAFLEDRIRERYRRVGRPRG